MRKTEEDFVYEAVSRYLKYTYPMLPFRFDYGAGATLFWGQALFQKEIQKGRAWPDLTIYAPQVPPKVIGVLWSAMFLEIKPAGYKLFKRDGITPVSDHIREQMAVIEHLKVAGYWAEFGIGTDDCIRKIDTYLLFTVYEKRKQWTHGTK